MPNSGACVDLPLVWVPIHGERRSAKGSASQLIPLTVPEVLRLLRLLILPTERRDFHLQGSRWRRQRQAAARRSHYCRRGYLEQEVPL